MSAASLDAILTAARERVAELQSRRAELERGAAAAPAPRPFGAALHGPIVGVIAEVKRRSPSAGEIRTGLDPVVLAAAYARGGAVAISVLTDPVHFGGSLDDLRRVAATVPIPVLRKDFILDELQILEAREAGASAVLLIARALDTVGLRLLARAAAGLGLGTLIEVHTEAELDAALAVEPTAVGVNSRDLATFAVDLGVAERLLGAVPAAVPAVGESGIEARGDVERLAAAGADLVLVGTAVARADDPGAAVRDLTGIPRHPRGHRG